MNRIFTSVFFIVICFTAQAQKPAIYSSSDILLRLKKLRVAGSVLYIAAHPDDENTRLLAYLANEKLYQTSYLSLTRGDGGQNLIGDEQGIELGLIRTQELLAARRTDGASQFFTRAYDFGFSKSTEEALQKWNKDLVLSDVVLLIRKLRPDVIITRFPEDNRAGHGHHSASAVLAHEAFKAAADPNTFPEQLTDNVQPWQAKRLLWNTYNFGSVNTQNEGQFKIDVGAYNALLGKSYGEIAAESRSQHKSQGFGVPAQRGTAFEYFIPTEGKAPKTDLMDDVDTSLARIEDKTQSKNILMRVDQLINSFSDEHPERSVAGLVKLYTALLPNVAKDYWQAKKADEVYQLIRICSGLYFEATTNVPYIAAGDSLPVNVNVVNRSGLNIKASITEPFEYPLPSPLPANQSISFSKSIYVAKDTPVSQPYWLEKGLNDGHFEITDRNLIGLPWKATAYYITINTEIDGQPFYFSVPVQYKHTDPVNGEIYQPLSVVPALSLNESPKFVFTHLNKQPLSSIKLNITSLTSLDSAKLKLYQYEYKGKEMIKHEVVSDGVFSLNKNGVKSYMLPAADILKHTKSKELLFGAELESPHTSRDQYYTLRKIDYPHIPSITYFFRNKVKVIDEEIITVGKKVGYIAGAGDHVPEALRDMGYAVTFLDEKSILAGDLKQFDAIVTGVRAYNIHDWLNNVYDALMEYVKQGGNLLVQYNTSNYIGPIKSRMGPEPFEVSRTRVTDENAEVHFLLPEDPVLNWPNKITAKDFENWVQERGIYFAENAKAYRSILSMKDPGEEEQPGSLIVSDYGKGRFIYTGLVFFRELPAGVGGAYRLFANLVANLNYKKINGTATKKK